MKQVTVSFICTILLFTSCKKESVQTKIAGQWRWTIQYSGGGPAYDSTPQSTGITEIFLFNTDGTYALVQNNTTVNSGTYKTSFATSTGGAKISSILFTNQRVTDSVAYYSLNNGSLFFSNDLIGVVGSGSRHYIKSE